MASLATAPAIIVPPPSLSRRRIELRPELVFLDDATGANEDDGKVNGACNDGVDLEVSRVSICVSTFFRLYGAKEEMAGSPLGLTSSLCICWRRSILFSLITMSFNL